MESVELIGFAAGILVALSSLPQFIKSWRTKSTRDIAALWIAINMAGQSVWIGYAVIKDSPSILVMALITIVMLGSILMLKLRYG